MITDHYGTHGLITFGDEGSFAAVESTDLGWRVGNPFEEI